MGLETCLTSALPNGDALSTESREPHLASLVFDEVYALLVNACGNEMHYTGITSCRGLGMPTEAFTGLHEVPLVSGAAFIARRGLLNNLGQFDELFFMYHEDTDVSLRARSRGHRILCAASAVVTHHYELQMSPTKFYYLERNRLLT